MFTMFNVCVFTVTSRALQKQLPSDLPRSFLCSWGSPSSCMSQCRINTHGADGCLCSVPLTWLWWSISWLCGMIALSIFHICKYTLSVVPVYKCSVLDLCYGLFFCPAGSLSLKQTGFVAERKKGETLSKLGTSSLPAELVNSLRLCLLSCPQTPGAASCRFALQRLRSKASEATTRCGQTTSSVF